MLTFLSQNIATILISLVLLAVVALAVWALVRRHRAGKSACGCNCGSCPMSGGCHSCKSEKPQTPSDHSS